MGRTVSLPESLRITMGIFVTGSIISPRIFISTSIVISSRSNSLYHHFACEAVGKSGGGNYRDIAAHSGNGGVERFEIHDFVLRSASDPLATGFVFSFNHYFKYSALVGCVFVHLDITLLFLQGFKLA